MAAVKQYLSYDEQVTRLRDRGMDVGNPGEAAAMLKRISYYRLSGYWYPFRRLVDGERLDTFFEGTTLADVSALYNFDSGLRAMTLAGLSQIELTVRASLGHELGRVHECAHLDPDLLGPLAQKRDYQEWLGKYEREMLRSREDFVEHHQLKYGGMLPVWAAVEILDWGGLTQLFRLSPFHVQDAVADEFGLSRAQMGSWLKSLNIVRNVSAHHGRLFNRVFALAPKLPAPGRYPDLDACASPGLGFTRAFGHLSLIQFMLRKRGIGSPVLLPRTLANYPRVQRVPVSHTGAPEDWQHLSLWSR
jgi:abortive infection bacteriophage resistance protein